VSSRLGNSEPLFPEGPALSEQAQLGLAGGEAGMGDHRGQDILAEALVAPRPLQGRRGLLVEVDRPPTVALGLIGLAEVAVRQRLQDDIHTGRGECEGTLGEGNGLVMRAHEVEMDCQKAGDLRQPTRVVESHREGLGLAQTR
jgi:hypothetical protein